MKKILMGSLFLSGLSAFAETTVNTNPSVTTLDATQTKSATAATTEVKPVGFALLTETNTLKQEGRKLTSLNKFNTDFYPTLSLRADASTSFNLFPKLTLYRDDVPQNINYVGSIEQFVTTWEQLYMEKTSAFQMKSSLRYYKTFAQERYRTNSMGIYNLRLYPGYTLGAFAWENDLRYYAYNQKTFNPTGNGSLSRAYLWSRPKYALNDNFTAAFEVLYEGTKTKKFLDTSMTRTFDFAQNTTKFSPALEYHVNPTLMFELDFLVHTFGNDYGNGKNSQPYTISPIVEYKPSDKFIGRLTTEFAGRNTLQTFDRTFAAKLELTIVAF